VPDVGFAVLFIELRREARKRIIYYFHSETMLLYLLTLFAKNERANLSKAERNDLAGLLIRHELTMNVGRALARQVGLKADPQSRIKLAGSIVEILVHTWFER